MKGKIFTLTLALIMLTAIPCGPNAAADATTDLVYYDFNSYDGANTFTPDGTLENQTLIAETAASMSRKAEGGIGGKTTDDKALVFTVGNIEQSRTAKFGYFGNSTIMKENIYGWSTNEYKSLTVEYEVFDSTQNGSFGIVCHNAAGPTNIEASQYSFDNISLTKNTWHKIALEFNHPSGSVYEAILYIDGKRADSITKGEFWARFPYLHLNGAANDEGIMALDNYRAYLGKYQGQTDLISYDFNFYTGSNTFNVDWGSIALNNGSQNYIGENLGNAYRSVAAALGGKSTYDKSMTFYGTSETAAMKAMFGPWAKSTSINWGYISDKNPILTVQYDVYDETESGEFEINFRTDPYSSGSIHYTSPKIYVPKNNWHTIAIEVHYNKYMNIYIDNELVTVDKKTSNYIRYPYLYMYAPSSDKGKIMAVDNYRIYNGSYENKGELKGYTTPEFSQDSLAAGDISVSMNAWNETTDDMNLFLIVAVYTDDGRRLEKCDAKNLNLKESKEDISVQVNIPDTEGRSVSAMLFGGADSMIPLIKKIDLK